MTGLEFIRTWSPEDLNSNWLMPPFIQNFLRTSEALNPEQKADFNFKKPNIGTVDRTHV